MYIFLTITVFFLSLIFIIHTLRQAKEKNIYPREPEYFLQFIQHVKIDFEILKNMSKEFKFSWEVKGQTLEIKDLSQNHLLGHWYLYVFIENECIQSLKKFFKTKTGEKKLYTQSGDFDF